MNRPLLFTSLIAAVALTGCGDVFGISLDGGGKQNLAADADRDKDDAKNDVIVDVAPPFGAHTYGYGTACGTSLPADLMDAGAYIVYLDDDGIGDPLPMDAAGDDPAIGDVAPERQKAEVHFWWAGGPLNGTVEAAGVLASNAGLREPKRFFGNGALWVDSCQTDDDSTDAAPALDAAADTAPADAAADSDAADADVALVDDSDVAPTCRFAVLRYNYDGDTGLPGDPTDPVEPEPTDPTDPDHDGTDPTRPDGTVGGSDADADGTAGGTDANADGTSDERPISTDADGDGLPDDISIVDPDERCIPGELPNADGIIDDCACFCTDDGQIACPACLPPAGYTEWVLEIYADQVGELYLQFAALVPVDIAVPAADADTDRYHVAEDGRTFEICMSPGIYAQKAH